MDKALVDGVWTVTRSSAKGGDVACDSEAAADALIITFTTPGRYRFTMEATIGPSAEEDAVVVDVETI